MRPCLPMECLPPPLLHTALILDADRLYADTLRDVTLKVFPGARVRLTTSLDEATLALETEPAELLVTRVSASLAGDVLELLARCTARRAGATRVLVVTALREYRLLSTLRTLNIEAVFDPSCDSTEQFMTALQAAAAGVRYWSSSTLEHLQRMSSAGGLFRVLTAFEQVVLSVVGDGCDDAEAARELGLSPATISTVRRELHRKLGVQHRGELVRIAAQHGFVRFTPAGVVRPGFALMSAAYRARRPKRAELTTAPEALADRPPRPSGTRFAARAA